MHVVVLGAGLLGVSSAWFLRQQGHEVTVIDRHAVPAAETSFANGGQISVSHAEPWAGPGTPRKVLKWLGQAEAPLLFRLRADPHQWRWALAFLRECTASRARANIGQLVRLGLYSRAVLGRLRAELDLHYDQQLRGILHFYTDPREFEHACSAAAQMREFGCDRRAIDANEAVRIEPALAQVRSQLAGATYTVDDESGDARQFVLALARHCEAAGVRFRMDSEITALRPGPGGLSHVEFTDAEGSYTALKGDAFVIALGSFSPMLLRPLGIHLPVYPAKGYSLTAPVRDPALAWQVSLTDDEFKLVYSRLGDRLRVAGTAELNGYERQLDPSRCEAILRRVDALFPGAADLSQARFWSGLRPTTPGNVPLIGRSRLPNLFLNTGHGTLGWTHACGSGLSLARIVSGLEPEVEFAFS